MIEATLRHHRILVAEDEYMIADEFCAELAEAGAVVIGPVATIQGALELIASEPEIDGAVLDINLGGEMIFPAAELLMERGVPIVFATGYDAIAIPTRFAHVARCEKPVNLIKVLRTIERVMAAGSIAS